MKTSGVDNRIADTKKSIRTIEDRIKKIKLSDITNNQFLLEAVKNLRLEKARLEKYLVLLNVIKDDPAKLNLIEERGSTAYNKPKTLPQQPILKKGRVPLSTEDIFKIHLQRLTNDIYILEKTKIRHFEIAFLENTYSKKFVEIEDSCRKICVDNTSTEGQAFSKTIMELKSRFNAKINTIKGVAPKIINIKKEGKNKSKSNSINGELSQFKTATRRKFRILNKFMDNVRMKSVTNIDQLSHLEIEFNILCSNATKAVKDESSGHLDFTRQTHSYNESIKHSQKLFDKWKSNWERSLLHNTKSVQKSLAPTSIAQITTKHSTESRIIVRWKDIQFAQGSIFVVRQGSGLFSYSVPVARGSYNHIKHYLRIPTDFNLTFVINIHSREVIKVEGIEILNGLFEIMKLRETIDMYKIGDISYFEQKFWAVSQISAL